MCINAVLAVFAVVSEGSFAATFKAKALMAWMLKSLLTWKTTATLDKAGEETAKDSPSLIAC